MPIYEMGRLRPLSCFSQPQPCCLWMRPVLAGGPDPQGCCSGLGPGGCSRPIAGLLCGLGPATFPVWLSISPFGKWASHGALLSPWGNFQLGEWPWGAVPTLAWGISWPSAVLDGPQASHLASPSPSLCPHLERGAGCCCVAGSW